MRRLLSLLLVAAGLGLVARGAFPCDVVTSQPVCYVALLPGPAESTYDQIAVDGTRTYGSAGEIVLTTVRVDSSLGLVDWVREAFDPTSDVVDRESIFPPGQDVEDVRRTNELRMLESQDTAAVAALRALGFDAPDAAQIVDVVDGSAAEAAGLEPGDVVVGVDGGAVASASELVEVLAARPPRASVTLTVARSGDRLDLSATLEPSPDDPQRGLLGIEVKDHLPVDVRIDAGEIGGPSAGLTYALAIIDLLGPEDLTGGRVVAGTGVIDRDGSVHPIGGIRQKILGALDRGEGRRPAEVFLVPEGNFEDARGAPVDRRVLLVPVATLQDALDALSDLRGGREPAHAVALGPAG